MFSGWQDWLLTPNSQWITSASTKRQLSAWRFSHKFRSCSGGTPYRWAVSFSGATSPWPHCWMRVLTSSMLRVSSTSYGVVCQYEVWLMLKGLFRSRKLTGRILSDEPYGRNSAHYTPELGQRDLGHRGCFASQMSTESASRAQLPLPVTGRRALLTCRLNMRPHKFVQILVSLKPTVSWSWEFAFRTQRSSQNLFSLHTSDSQTLLVRLERGKSSTDLVTSPWPSVPFQISSSAQIRLDWHPSDSCRTVDGIP